MKKGKVNKVVLAYSGGLDTSCIVPWLKENYGCEVITFTADLGQGADELAGLEQKALASGASKAYIMDLREEFLMEYAFRTMRAGAIYERLYLLGTSFARPVTAKHLVKVAEQEGADAVAHGCTGKGNDQVRFELSVKALNPHLKVIAPWREWEIRSREDALAYARAHNVPVAVTEKSIYSRDRNLWHISHEGGVLEDPWAEPEESMFMLTVAPEAAPDTPQYLTLKFERGYPVALDGEALGPVQILERLNDIGGAHGVGRVDLVENRLVGMKSRGVYERPAAQSCTRRTRGWSRFAWTARRCTTRNWSRIATPNWCTTASGSRPCARRWTPSWTRRRSALRAPCGSNCTKARVRWSGASRRLACTARTSPPSARMTCTTKATPRVSSTCSACR